MYMAEQCPGWRKVAHSLEARNESACRHHLQHGALVAESGSLAVPSDGTSAKVTHSASVSSHSAHVAVLP